ncbi:MAG: hypothetical protein HQK51_14710, partial [Oligoflexia bacterium]|nr:hypothetical protein [Oligoflexia bacterium]
TVSFDGLLPLQKAKVSYAYSLISTNFLIGEKAFIEDKYFELKNSLINLGKLNLGSFFDPTRNVEDQYLYLNTQALPRAYIAKKCFVSDDLNTSIKNISDEKKFKLGDKTYK